MLSGMLPVDASNIQLGELYATIKAISYSIHFYPGLKTLEINSDNLDVVKLLNKKHPRANHFMQYSPVCREYRAWILDTCLKHGIKIKAIHVRAHSDKKNAASICNNLVDKYAKDRLRFQIKENNASVVEKEDFSVLPKHPGD
jgi:hypothetical protein